MHPFTDQPPDDEGLRRVLGPFDATCIVVGAIIGVGIFFTPGGVARAAGSGGRALTAWAIAGGIALLGALCFAELGSLYRRSGAQYEALRDAWGALPAFLFVFCNATGIQAGATAVIAAVCAENIGIAAGRPLGGAALTVVAALLILGLVAANGAGVRFGAGIQNATVLAKVATLLGVTAVALLLGSRDPGGGASGPPRNAAPGVVGATAAALVPALFAYGGWQQALWVAGEVRRPQRNVPLAIVGGVVLVVTVYVLANWAYLRLLGYDGVAGSSATAADAIGAVWPAAGRRITAAAVAVSALGVLNAQLLAGPRLVYAMARDGRFFRIFAGSSARFGTPLPAILLIGSAALFLLLLAGKDVVSRLLTGVVFVDAVFFALTGAAVIALRRRRPEALRPVRVPAAALVAALFVAGELGVLAGAMLAPDGPGSVVVGALWIAAGAACYALFFPRAVPRAAPISSRRPGGPAGR
jgi:APA family basic amino acid/polyamine antiporter